MKELSQGEELQLPSNFCHWRRGQLHRVQREENVRWSMSFVVVVLIAFGGFWLSIPTPIVLPPSAARVPARDAMNVDMVSANMPLPHHADDTTPQQAKQTSQAKSIPSLPMEKKSLLSHARSSMPRPKPPSRRKKRDVTHAQNSLPMKLQKLTQSKASRGTKTAAEPAPTQDSHAQEASRNLLGVSSKSAVDAMARWQDKLLMRLERFKRYPPEAMAQHQEGTPSVTFVMDREGVVLSSTLTQSSGYDLLDQEAAALPRRAGPLPPVPESVKGRLLTFTVPIEFSINKDD